MAVVKYAGLNSIQDDELVELRDALNFEIHSRLQKVTDDLGQQLSRNVTSVLERGFSITIETDEDEVTILPEQAQLMKVVVSAIA